MAHVGTGTAGKVLTAKGVTQQASFRDIGSLSGLTDHGVLLAQGSDPFTATAAGTTGQVLMGNTGGDPSFQNGGSVVGQTITGDSGGALAPTAGNWNIVSTATNGIDASGSGSTLTIAMSSPYADGDFSFARSASGTANIFTVSNTSNTASSKALFKILVGGSSAGDPVLRWDVSGVTQWTMGIDNADSDKLKIAPNLILANNPFFEIDPTAQLPTFLSSYDGSPFGTIVKHTINTALSSAYVNTQVAGAIGGDAYYKSEISGGQAWTWGLDNSDSDAYALSSNATLGTTNVMRVATTGEINFPLQPSFNAYLSGNSANATGDATLFTIPYNAENFDVGNDFAANIFTAPVTGKYLFTINTSLFDLGALHTSGVSVIFTTAQTYSLNTINVGACRDLISGSNFYGFNNSVIAYMAAGDTAAGKVQVSGSTKTVGVDGRNGWTNFTGQLLS